MSGRNMAIINMYVLESTKTCTAKPNRVEGRTRRFIDNWGLQCPIFSNGWDNQAKYQQANIRQYYYKTTRPGRYLQTHHPTVAEYTFLYIHEGFSMIDHILDHKIDLDNF